MGLLKIAALIVGPVAGMTYAAFSLGRQLPKATRRFGNYIGLSYVYFKTVLKVLKPEDQMPYQIIEVARKASQQSQALRRQLRNTIVKAKEDFKAKHDETMSNFESKIKQAKTNPIVVAETQGGTQGSNDSGSHTMKEILLLQTQLLEKRRLKVESRKFFDEL